jgi:osmotically-inducible protein OsmY
MFLVLAVSAGPLWAALPEVTDQRIVYAIEHEMLDDDGVDVNRIEVSATDGIVMLTGTVEHILAKQRATAIAEGTVGVRSVVNRIDVEPDVAVDDAALARAVTDALYLNPATERYEVEVAAESGAVTLEGVVDSWHEQQLCVIVAKGVKGVREVRDEIEIHYDRSRGDDEIRSEIEAFLANDVGVDDMLIEVDVEDGRVTLRGSVGSLVEKSRAVHDSWVTGVNTVDARGLEVVPWIRDEMRRTSLYEGRTDTEIQTAVEDAFRLDPRVSEFDPTVDVIERNVILTGTVDNLQASRAAEQDAKNTLGVLRVKNHIKVRPRECVPDLELEQRVRRALSVDVYVDRIDVSVHADGGRVYLSGKVNNSFERSHAGVVAAGVKGVVTVTNDLDYEHRWNPAPDWEIREDVRDHLLWSPFVDAEQVEVSVDDGVVTLTGVVDTWTERAAAEINAWDGGAKDVRNHLVAKYRIYGPYGPTWPSPYSNTP